MRVVNKIVELFRKVINRYFKWIIKFPASEILIRKMDSNFKESKLPLIVFPPGTPWGYMFQRPQQLAREFSKIGYTVLYCVDTNYPHFPDWGVRGILQLEHNLYLFNDGKNGTTLKSIKQEKIYWQYWPKQNEFIKNICNINKDIRVYDAIDHPSTFLQYKGLMEDLEESIELSDAVFASANNIRKDLMKYGKNIELIPNGVSLTDFEISKLSTFYTTDVLDKLKNIKKRFKYVVGYYGAIAEWFNFEFVYYAAKMHPDTAFILIGPKYPNIKIEFNNNLFYFDTVSYKDIPYILQLFDIAMLPFKTNSITENTSPVKIFEYMAGKKVIVSSELPEIENIDTILFSENKYSFSENITKAFTLKSDNLFLLKQYEYAKNYTWEIRVKEISAYLQL